MIIWQKITIHVSHLPGLTGQFILLGEAGSADALPARCGRIRPEHPRCSIRSEQARIRTRSGKLFRKSKHFSYIKKNFIFTSNTKNTHIFILDLENCFMSRALKIHLFFSYSPSFLSANFNVFICGIYCEGY